MNSFLHRLAGAVLRPQQRIHPLVGSLYSGHHIQPEIEEEAKDANDVQSSRLRAPEFSPHESQAGLNSSLFEEQTENRAPVQNEPQQAAAIEADDHHSKTTLRGHREGFGKSESTAKALSDRPSPAASIVPRTSETSVALMGRTVHPGASPRPMIYAAQSERPEPDEIQIHIGRIEVTAVPQTRPSTPARAARKAPALDEYLRRRDERGR